MDADNHWRKTEAYFSSQSSVENPLFFRIDFIEKSQVEENDTVHSLNSPQKILREL